MQELLYHKMYQLDNTKPWVVFIHGAGGSSSIWYKQIKEFKKHFNILLIDLRGHGKSQKYNHTNKHYTFTDIARDIVKVLDAVKISSAHFVGISLGTVIIRTLGEIAPERISSMILGGAITRLNIRSRFLAGLGNLFKRVMPYMWLYNLFAFIIMPRKRHRESRLLFVNEARKLCQKEFLRWYRLTYEINPLLRYFNEKELKTPTLYLMGDEDYMFLPTVKHVVSRHAHSRLEVIGNSGHVCNIDQPETFNRLAVKFIQGQA
jgi:pimeloyl-ACP methyl ester carboxylesterase